MTEKEKYEILLGEFAEIIKQKNETIALQDWQIAGLKEKLAAAEIHHKTTERNPVELEIR